MPALRALILACACVLLSGGARAEPLACADQAGVWVVAPDTRAGAVLFFLPADATDALARVADSFPVAPIALACDADSAFLLFAHHPSNTPKVELHPARLITRETDSGARPAFTRPVILAPLPAHGEIVSIALVDETPLVLRRDDDPSGPALTLVEQRRNEWTPIALPDAVDPAGVTWLLAIGAQPALAQQDASHTVHLWTLTSFGASGPTNWTEQSLAAPKPIDRLLTFPAGPRALAHTDSHTLEVLALKDGRLGPVRTIDLGHDLGAVAPWGTGLALFWNAPDTDAGLAVRLLSADDQTLYDGPLRIAGPVSPGELQVLVILLSAVFFTAVVFMLRPDRRATPPINLPPNASLASPARRFVAFLIDLIPGVAVAYVVWFTDARTLEAVATILANRGAQAILTLAGVTILLSTIGEATTGRTLGKALTRCRTISYTGGRPLWRQALARNVVKVLCPPIGLLVLLAPASPHPGSFDTLVIVDHPPDDAAGSGSPPQDPSDPA